MQILSEREVASVETDHVVVRKALLDLGLDQVAGIRLTVESRDDRPLAVELVEVFPQTISLSDVEVHPNFNPDRWTAEEFEGRMIYEDELPPRGTVETVYGVRASEAEIAPLLDGPATVEVSPLPREASSEDGPVDDSAHRATDGSNQETPDSPVTGPETERTGVKSSADDDPDVAATHTPDSSFEYGEERNDTPPARSTVTHKVDMLVDALARAELSEDQQRALRRSLGIDQKEREQPQLASLQSSVAELQAFAEEFEHLVDDVDSPSAAIEALRAAREELAGRVEELAASVERATAEREAIHARLDEVATAAEGDADVEALVAEHVGELGGELRDRLDALESAVEEVDEVSAARFDSLADEVYEQDRRHVERLDALADELAELRGVHTDRLDEFENRLADLETQFDAEELSAIQEVIAAERRWRDRAEAVRSRAPKELRPGRHEG